MRYRSFIRVRMGFSDVRISSSVRQPTGNIERERWLPFAISGLPSDAT
jgi:hypothetical protein